jgi:hypothetical protein
MRDHRPKPKFQSYREKNEVSSWWKNLQLFTEIWSHVDRNMAWIFSGFSCSIYSLSARSKSNPIPLQIGR